MTQKIRAINIANNTFKSFVFDSTVSNLINVAAVAYSTANAANALVQAANTLIVSQTLQIANAAPTINTVLITDSSYNILDDTAANTGGAYLRVTGSGFQSGAIVMVGTSNTALSTTFVDSNTLRAQIGAIASGTYPVYVVNTNGGTAIRLNALTVSSLPVWGTGSTLANVTSGTVFSTSLSANSDSSITYSNTTILPTGTTLLSNGYFYGSISVGSATTYSFDVKATDVELQDQTRTFSLTVVKSPYTVDYLVVAGGGGGGGTSQTSVGGAGGGAGGILYGSYSANPGTSYSITIGAGGSGGIYEVTTNSVSNGSDTSIFGLTAFGGGAGGMGATFNHPLYSNNGHPGLNGGSGGGGSGAHSSTSGPWQGGSAGSAINYPGPTAQGYPGGSGGFKATNGQSGGPGGGGGATSSGENGPNSPSPSTVGFRGLGGTGYTWPYTASTYSSGGNGGTPAYH